METLMIRSRSSLQHFLKIFNISTTSIPSSDDDDADEKTNQIEDKSKIVVAVTSLSSENLTIDKPTEDSFSTSPKGHKMDQQDTLSVNTSSEQPFSSSTEAANFSSNYTNHTTIPEYFPSYWSDGDELIGWNSSYVGNLTTNVTNYNISDYELLNVNSTSLTQGFWFCAKWVDAQQDLFQAANICFAIAFLVPKSFKQSILIVRALAAAGFVLLAAWASTELCAPDVLGWNIILVIINSVHTVLLIIRFLPPALSLEMTELYLRLFKPLKVSKKHFKELTKEARLIKLEAGEPYSVEGVTPADERLSILLKGKMKVYCDQTQLHMIHPQQFVDSPEWEANHEQSDDVSQVTIIAEEGCTYLCWPRMRLERVLRHRPMLKIVFDSIIGKDITHKLYSLNEQMAISAAEGRATERATARMLLRSLSADAVDVGARGKMRSNTWRKNHNSNVDKFPPGKGYTQQWKPVASQFPQTSPFPTPRSVIAPRTPSRVPLLPQTSSSSLPFAPPAPLLSPPKKSLRKASSFRKNREVTFADSKETTIL